MSLPEATGKADGPGPLDGPAPFFADVAGGPEGAQAVWLTAADGIRLRAVHWTGPAATAGTVLIFTGRTEFVEKYGVVAAELLSRGFASLSADWRGQGLSARLQPNRAVGHVTAFSDYQRDVEALVAHATKLGLPRPFFLLGHSMGGCIGLRSLLSGIDVKAAAFTSPMWGIRIAAALRPLAWGLSALSRPLRFGHVFAPGQSPEAYIRRIAFEANTLTTDRAMFEMLRRQIEAHPDLALGGPSLHWLNEALHEMRALARAPAPDVPCVTFLGLDEMIVDAARIRDRMADWPGGALVELDGARHELLIERPELRDRVYDRIAKLFLG